MQVRGVRIAVRLASAAPPVRVSQDAVLTRRLGFGLRPARGVAWPPLGAEPLLERGGVGRTDDVADDTLIIGLDDERQVGVPDHIREDEDLGPQVVVLEDPRPVGAGVRRLEADVGERRLVTGSEGADAGHPTSLGAARHRGSARQAACASSASAGRVSRAGQWNGPADADSRTGNQCY